MTDKPFKIFANFAAGGVPAGVTQGVVTRYIEEETGLPFSNLVHGVHAASAGTMTAIPLLAPGRDNPNIPRFTAQEAAEIFKENAQKWLPNLIRYDRQHIARLKHMLASAFSRAAEQANYYLRDDIVSETLNSHLGGVLLEDINHSIYITAHNYTARSASESATIFSKEILENGTATYSHDRNLPIIDPMQASMAVPGHYRSKHIKDVGYFSDIGHVHGGLPSFIRFKNNQPKDQQVAYIELGTPRFHGLLSPHKHDLCSAFDMVTNGYLLGSTSNQSYSQAMQTLPHLVSDGKFFDLSPDFDRQQFTSVEDLPFSENFLNASARNIAKIEDTVREHIHANKDRFESLAHFLGENYQASCRPEPVTFVPPITQTPNSRQRKSWLSSLLGGRPSPPPQPVAA